LPDLHAAIGNLNSPTYLLLRRYRIETVPRMHDYCTHHVPMKMITIVDYLPRAYKVPG
jgi:tRNA A37 threonylcarbamoyladenosine biosynthesis protein TsaE